MKPHILIIGSGKLAQAIGKQCIKEKVSFDFWEHRKKKKHTVVLYCGSKLHLKEVWEYCIQTNTPMMLLSTDVKTPQDAQFPFFFTPNTSTEVLQFIDTVTDFATKTAYSKVSIIESHQSTKKDISGTALLLARLLGTRKSDITSIRDSKKQLALGISKKHLEGHAYHQVTFRHDGVTTTFSVLVEGRETYAKGAINLAKNILRKQKAAPGRRL